MRKKICVVSTSRADYYLLSLICKKIKLSKKLCLYLVASGDHFLKSKGNTYKDILNDKINIDFKIPMNLRDDKVHDISNDTGNSFLKFQRAISLIKPDLLLILGDRFELLAPVSVALLNRIPIAHLHGGEITEGAIDDSVRHAITKMSNIHFVCNKYYKKRVVQLGENPKYVFNVGGIGSDVIANEKLFTKKQLEKILNISLNKKIILVTCHPETNNQKTPYIELFKSLRSFSKKNIIIFTYPNSDLGNKKIRKIINQFIKINPSYLFTNLGRRKYLSLLKNASLVVGNSSSGILEAPYLRVPTLNVGDRQKGRKFATSIFSCQFKKKLIDNAINILLKKKNFIYSNFYKNKNASDQIVKKLNKINFKELKIKKFYDI